MNLDRHIKSHVDLADHLAKGETDKADVIKTFYDEYFAVMDLPADFYIETVRDVFQEHLLPKGELTYKGRMVNPGAIKRMGLMTVEGERGRHLLTRPDPSGARPLHRRARLSQGSSHAGRRRPLRAYSADAAGITRSIPCSATSFTSTPDPQKLKLYRGIPQTEDVR